MASVPLGEPSGEPFDGPDPSDLNREERQALDAFLASNPDPGPDYTHLRRLLGPNRRRLIVINDLNARDRATAFDLLGAGWVEYDGPGTAQLGWYQGDDPKIGPQPAPLMRGRRAQG